jgi:hypothetical protein
MFRRPGRERAPLFGASRQTDPLRRLWGHVGAPQDVAQPQDMSESLPDGQRGGPGEPAGRSSEMPA